MMNLNKKYKIINSLSMEGTTFEVLELDDLEGATEPSMAEKLFFAKQQGLRIRLIKATINNSSIKTEAGALYYYRGNIQAGTDVKGIGSFLKKAVIGSVTEESLSKPEYFGTGEIYLEPSFKHYLLVQLNNSSIIVDKNMFYAATSGIEITSVIQSNLSSAVLGNEGLFQIKLKGTGIVVLESEVPESEIEKIELNGNEILKVDGNFAILRTEKIKFSVTKSNKGLLSSAIGGEGFLNTFEGVGTVWLAPTLPLYHKLSTGMTITNKGSNHT